MTASDCALRMFLFFAEESMRDRFAIAALSGIMANDELGGCMGSEKVARLAYGIADAMLKARAE